MYTYIKYSSMQTIFSRYTYIGLITLN